MSGASTEDWDVASMPVARLPLDSLRDARLASLVFVVPTTDQWVRIRDAWFLPNRSWLYVVFGRADVLGVNRSLSWNSLGLDVHRIDRTSGRSTLTTAGSAPDSMAAVDTGVAFRPRPRGERSHGLMLCAFQGAPRIVRFHGRGSVFRAAGSGRHSGLAYVALFPAVLASWPSNRSHFESQESRCSPDGELVAAATCCLG